MRKRHYMGRQWGLYTVMYIEVKLPVSCKHLLAVALTMNKYEFAPQVRRQLEGDGLLLIIEGTFDFCLLC